MLHRTTARLAFTAFEDIDPTVHKDWLLKGVIAGGETSSWVGGPGQGKSALLTDIGVHLAAGRPWRGYRCPSPAAVVIHALERGDLLKRRLDAYRRKWGLDRLPIAVITEALDFMNLSSVAKLVSTVEAVENHYNMGVGLLIIDTYAKAIAAGGGDENAAKDQNRVLGHLRQVQAATGSHIALVGHTGKDESKGARGSNAHLGDVDVMVQFSGEKVKEAKVTKANDQPEGRLTVFELETYEFGLDEDGDPITTSIVASDTPDADVVTKRATVSARQRLALDALDAAVGNFGEDPPADLGLPGTVKAVSFQQWQEELLRRDVLSEDDPHLKSTYYKLRKDMAAKRLIGIRDMLAWRV
ncbi:MAG TPA: AAA family ATPase [Roseomonas sp.]